MKSKPEVNILLFIDWFLPGYKAGGPIQSCANLIANLKNEYNFKVVTGDTDLGESQPYPAVKSNAWNMLEEKIPVFYFSATEKKYARIKKILLSEKFDVLYTNSFFSIPFTIFPLLVVKFNKINCKVIVAPRGMMGKGSLSIKPLKKKLFIFVAKLTGLFNNVIWHASTPGEQKEIEAIFGPQAKIKKAINLTAPRTVVKYERKKSKGEVRFFCLARISPVKNILAIFKYLLRVDSQSKIVIDFYGSSDDDKYLEECKSLKKLFPDTIKANFLGPLPNNQVEKMTTGYHFMILPTFNENFGHAIVESLIAGCPVLISNCTPWKNLETLKAGWDLPLNDDRLFIEKINTCVNMEQVEYDSWSEGASAFARKILSNQEALKENKELFLV